MQSINHQQAQEYLHMRQSELNETEHQALQAHLTGCAECREYAASLEMLQPQLRTAFHLRWDGIQPVKSRTGGVLIRLGREIMRIRINTFAGTLVGVFALIALVLGLNFVLSNLQPRPAVVPVLPTGTSTFQPTIPSPTGVITPTNTLVPSVTPLPEGSIVLNWGYSIIPPNPEFIASGESWAQGLSAASGLNVVTLPGPTSDMEILEGLRDGKIQMAELDALAFGYGQAQGWIMPGPVMKYTYQPSGSIMFVARIDSGLVPGELPEVFQQLIGKRPCWPDINQGFYFSRPPIYEYILPTGLLAQAGVKFEDPVFVTYTDTHRDVTTEVFLRECDFAVVEAMPEKYFLMIWSPYLASKGATITDWETQMQVLYTTPSLEPYHIMAFSSQLDATKREHLTNALLNVPAVQGSYGVDSWQPYDENQAAIYDQFQALVDASGVDVASYLSRVWDQYLQGLINAALTPSPAPTPTNAPSTRTLTICEGAEPDTLYFYGGNMLAASNVLEAIYDGPIDSTGFSYQPVILEKLPSLADGDASIKPITVKENDFVINDAGEVVLLRPGEVVRPYGCNLSACAITWQGGALEMAQMSATFTLKDNIRWSDGEPLTADDSVFGFEMATSCKSEFDPTTACGSLGAGGQQTVKGTASYTALDEYTTLWVGLPGFLDQTYMTNFAHPLPRHQMQTYTPQQFLDVESRSPMGWGPYIIDKWQPGAYIRMSKNPYYFRSDEGLPHFDQLTFRFIATSGDGMVTALQNGACDLLDQEAAIGISLDKLVKLNNQGLVKGLISTGTTWEHLDFNIRPAESILNTGAFAGWDLDGDGQGPFGDVRLRQAIAMCLDRRIVVDELFLTVDNLFLGQSIVPNTYLPLNHPLINTQVAIYSNHPLAASTLLDEIGWKDTDNDSSTPRVAMGVTGVPDGTPLEMNYETTDAPLRQQITQILAQSLAGCGIKVNIALHSAGEWFAAGPDGPLYGRKYDLGEFAWKTSVIPPCDLFLSSEIPGAGNNWSGQDTPGFANQAFDDACNLQMQSLPGEDTFIEGALEAQRIFSEQLPVVPLFLVLKTAASRPDMCGYSLDPTSPSDFWNIEAFDYGPGCR